MRVIRNNMASSPFNDGMYIGYQNASSGITRIFGGGSTGGGIAVNGGGVNDVTIAGNIALNAGNYNSYSPTLTGGGASGTWSITATGNVASRGQSNWNDATVINNVVGMLAWKNYGNAHVIFDASQGTSPSGGGVSQTNATYAWAASYPTLMGWNGGNTYGVRVDSARVADNTSGNSATTSQRDFSGDISTSGMGRFTGWYTGNAATGLAAEIGISAGQAYIIAYNRQTSTYGTLNLESSAATLRLSGSTVNVISGALQQGGNQVLHAGNFNSYSPTLTGGGASGTWGINITGNSVTVGGYGVSTGASANTVVVRDSNAYTFLNYINSNTSNFENPTVSQVIVTNGTDNYYRKAGIDHLTTAVRSSASGTWGINITGSAGSAGSASTASLVNGTSGGAIQTWDVRTISPSTMTSYRMGFGFTSWANNNSAPYADYLHLRSYGDGSGGSDNLVTFLKSGFGMRIWQQSFGSSSPYSSYVDVLHSSNYSSYALPLSGGELSGPLYVGTTGSGVYTTHWKDGGGSYQEAVGNSTSTRKLRLQSFNGSSSYAQWYMDGGNMQIYGDVAGVRNFLIDSTTAYLRWGGGDRLWGGSDGTRNSGWAYHQDTSTGLHWPGNGWHLMPASNSDFRIYSGNSSNTALRFETAGTTRGYVYAENDNTIGFLTNGRSWAFRTYSNGNAQVYGYLTVNGAGTSSSIYMNDTDEGQREIHCNSNRIGFLTQAGAWGAWSNDNGSWESVSSVTTNDWFYVNGGGGLYWSSYGRGLRSPDAEGNPYGNVNTYGSGRNGWLGYGVGTQFAFMGRESTDIGVHDLGYGWIFYSPYATGRMGIGTSTTSSSYRLYVEGGIYATGDVVAYSDRRKKTNVETIENALQKVTSLRGVFYNKIGEENKGRQLGVIAQEVDEVLPEAVNYAADVDEYGVKYGNMVGVLIEAIKEQQKQIEDLKSIIDGLTS
jgi:hypothetical protein